jgi:hypothetical protein
MYVTIAPKLRQCMVVPSGIGMVMLPCESMEYGSIILAQL